MNSSRILNKTPFFYRTNKEGEEVPTSHLLQSLMEAKERGENFDGRDIHVIFGNEDPSISVNYFEKGVFICSGYKDSQHSENFSSPPFIMVSSDPSVEFAKDHDKGPATDYSAALRRAKEGWHIAAEDTKNETGAELILVWRNNYTRASNLHIHKGEWVKTGPWVKHINALVQRKLDEAIKKETERIAEAERLYKQKEATMIKAWEEIDNE